MAGGGKKKEFLGNKPTGIDLELSIQDRSEPKMTNSSEGRNRERVVVQGDTTLLSENSDLKYKEESIPTQKKERKEKKSAAEREKKKEEKKSKQKSQNDTEDKSEASSGGDSDVSGGGGGISGGGGAGGAGPSISSSGASSGSVSQKSESQLTSKKVVINLFYSIYDDGELDGAGKKTIGEQVENGSMGKMDYHVDAFHSGDPTEEDRYFTYVECGGLLYDVTSESVDDNEGMNACLGFGIDQIIDILQGIKDNEHSSYDVTINLAGYDLNEGLVQIAKHLVGGNPPERIKNKEYNLLTDADKKYLQAFTDLKADSFSLGIGYTCVYNAQEVFSAKSKEREMQQFREQLEWAEIVADSRCNGSVDFAGCYVTEFNRSMGVDVMSPSEQAHLMLGIGSLCFFYPPFAFACLAADLTLHIIECAACTLMNDKQGTVEHFKGAALDFIFIIPIGKAVKCIRQCTKVKVLTSEVARLTKALPGAVKGEAIINRLAPVIKRLRDRLPQLRNSAKELEANAANLEKEVADAEKALSDLYRKEINATSLTRGGNYSMADDAIRSSVSKNSEEIYRIQAKLPAQRAAASEARAAADKATAFVTKSERQIAMYDKKAVQVVERDLAVDDLHKITQELENAEKELANYKELKNWLPANGWNTNMLAVFKAFKDVKLPENVTTLRRLIAFTKGVLSKENISRLAKYLRDPETIQGYLGDAVTINGMLPNGPQKDNAVNLGGATIVTEDWSWSEVPGLAWESFKDDVKKIPDLFSSDDDAETGVNDNLIPEGEQISEEEMRIQMKQTQYLDTHLTFEEREQYYEDVYWMDLPNSKEWKDDYVDFNSPTPGQPVYPENWQGPSVKTQQALQNLERLQAGEDEEQEKQYSAFTFFSQKPADDY